MNLLLHKLGSPATSPGRSALRIAEEEAGTYDEGATRAWQGMVKKFRLEDASTSPSVSLIANDNWIEFTVRYIVDYKARRSTRDRLFTRVLDAVDASGGKLAMASMTVHLVEMPRVNVTMEGGG